MMNEIIKQEIEVKVTPVTVELPELAPGWRMPLMLRNRNGINIIYGGRQSGKSTFARYLILEALAEGRKVGHINPTIKLKNFEPVPHNLSHNYKLLHDFSGEGDILVIDNAEFTTLNAILGIMRSKYKEIWVIGTPTLNKNTEFMKLRFYHPDQYFVSTFENPSVTDRKLIDVRATVSPEEFNMFYCVGFGEL